MNNRILLAALAGGVVMFLAGWVIYGMLLMDTMRDINPGMASVAKDPPMIGGIFVSNVLGALLYAIIYDRWAGINTFKAGAIAGAWITALISLSFDINMLSMSTLMSLNGTVVDVVASTVLGALGGGAVGWVLGYKRA